MDLPESSALSIVKNGPESFKGRKIGVLLTNGSDMNMVEALKKAAKEEGTMVEILAPKVGGVEASDGSWIEAKQRINGGPSVLYDAVVLLPSGQGVQTLVQESTARDFVADAFAHAKFIGYAEAAMPLMEKAGIAEHLDEGCIQLEMADDFSKFIQACRNLRFWERESEVHAV